MKREFRTFFCRAAFVAALTGCGAGSASQQVSSTKGLAHGGDERNAAVLVGSPHNLEGVATDVREFGNLLRDQQYDFRFQDVRQNADADAEEILDLTGEAAAEADTLLWFFSGHGNTGILLANDRTFTFHEVAERIREARHGKLLERLVVFIDSCYSGSFVDGEDDAIIEDGSQGGHGDGGAAAIPCMRGPRQDPTSATVPPATVSQRWAESAVFSELAHFDQNLFKEAFVMSSSTRFESSVDLGAEMGGAFTWSLRQVIADLKRTRDNSTLAEFAENTSERTEETGGHTPVFRGFPSDMVLAEKIFHYAE